MADSLQNGKITYFMFLKLMVVSLGIKEGR
jgi:hypothetical protein